MDITIEQKSPNLIRKYWYVPVIALGVFGAMLLRQTLSGVTYVVDDNLLRVADVKLDNFSVEVRGVGELVPREYHWISTEVEGHVAALFVRAGDSVDVGEPLIRLRNQQLLSTLEKVDLEYQQAEAEARANIKSLESQLLQLESELLQSRLALKSELLRLEAEETLMKQLEGSVSEIDHQITVFAVEEQKEMYAFYQRRVEKMRENISAQRVADKARVSRLKNDLANAQREVDALTVRSRSQGLVQEIDLELGQKLPVGTTVAVVADDTQLIAELKIQELQVQNVNVGQDVIVDTRRNKLRATVARIHPTVTNGMVQVDAEFIDSLSPEARVALSVEGTIKTLELENALYVQRPASVQPNSTVGIFMLDANGYQARKVPVQLGQSSANYVQILGGLQVGDTIVISDTTAYAQHEVVLIN